jgi:hypothetical protein
MVLGWKGKTSMLTYKPATCEQYDEFWQLMLKEAADYLERTMELMQMTL